MLQITSSTNLNILLENLLFLVISTSFLGFVGFLWRESKPFSLPQTLPAWFSAWLAVVLVVGLALPLVVMILWGVWWGNRSVLQALIPYFVMLGLQILSERVTLKQFHSCVWVLIPCLYLPYRFWQLYIGLTLVSFDTRLIWVQRLLAVEIVLWIFNYGVHLSQIPRLLRWEVQPQSDG
ncbi:hypothetical protein [Microcoleus sp. FACHB-68]|uniref:DUF7733 domain-containing protein n=1 Tax=Microcoleus sp. FACHB-68 TaxID=2692826 RepID=UPI001685DEDC|nr:hypothetical protein [Microcoleus sp. FACHB-68]MBD1939204.1 hypothetical protein [Microcoleus sp. FACHB-68]